MKRIVFSMVLIAGMVIPVFGQSFPEEKVFQDGVTIVSHDNDDRDMAFAQTDKTTKRRSKATAGTKSAGSMSTANNSTGRINPESLAVYELFGEKYKRTKGCKLTVYSNDYTDFSQLEVNDNKEIVNRIRQLVEQDKKKAVNVNTTYSPEEDRIILDYGYGVSVGLYDCVNEDKCRIFINISNTTVQ